MKIYKLDLCSPLDMEGAGGNQDNGWFEAHGIQVVSDSVLLCATKGPILEWLPTYDNNFDPDDTGWEIEEINYEPKPTKGPRTLTDEERDRMTSEIIDDFTSQSHGDGQCEDIAAAELNELDDADFINVYESITADDLED